MNFAQRLGLFILIVISIVYVYFTFFNKTEGSIFDKWNVEEKEVVENDSFNIPSLPDVEYIEDENSKGKNEEVSESVKVVKIFISDSNNNLRSVNRSCNTKNEKSCIEFAIKELLKAPSKWEKSKGFTSEIPSNTKLLSVRESKDVVRIDLSQSFENGGGTDSTYRRVMQLIKTAKANTNKPVYLYLNGQKAEVIGGDGIMIKQPLNERSLDD